MEIIHIFGDSNIDLFYNASATDELKKIKGKLGDEIRKNIIKVKNGEDVEVYHIPKGIKNTLEKIKSQRSVGGCAANKALLMAKLGKNEVKVFLHSIIGKDRKGDFILKEFERYNVDTKYIKRVGRTYKTYNIHIGNKRLAYSEWKPPRFSIKKLDGIILLTGSHRIKKSMGYSKMAKKMDAYVFTGSFATYSKSDLKRKYKNDLKFGRLVCNGDELKYLIRAFKPRLAYYRNRKKAIQKWAKEFALIRRDELIIHDSFISCMSNGEKIIVSKPKIINEKDMKCITGMGDVWEAAYILARIKGKSIKESMDRAHKIAGYFIKNCKLPNKI